MQINLSALTARAQVVATSYVLESFYGNKGKQQLQEFFLKNELKSLHHVVKIAQYKLCLYTVADTNEKNGSQLSPILYHSSFRIIIHFKVF